MNGQLPAVEVRDPEALYPALVSGEPFSQEQREPPQFTIFFALCFFSGPICHPFARYPDEDNFSH